MILQRLLLLMLSLRAPTKIQKISKTRGAMNEKGYVMV